MNEGNIGEPISAGLRSGKRQSDDLEIRFESGVDLTKIRTVLGQARERAGAPVERVLTLNLVAVHFSDGSWTKAMAGVEAACALHPARLVILIADPKSVRSEVTVRVSVRRPKGAAFFLERIVLTASGTAVRHLESAMLGLLVPEVPVVILWGGRAEGELLSHAVELSDRVIIDSGTRSPDGLRHVSHLVRRGAPVGDLAWARIFPWQSLAADVLDIPNLREHRGGIKSARITSAGEPGAEALLLAGWFQSRVKRARVTLVAAPTPEALAAQAGEPVTAGEREATGSTAGVLPARLETTPSPLEQRPPPPEPVRPGQILELQFEAPPAEFIIRREKAGVLEAQVRGDDDGEIVHRLRLPPEAPGRLLVTELKLLHGIDEVYGAALEEAARFVGLRGGRR
jgi:glucose-6-phosphate dehydrogenase assembly protein OpcA